MRFFSFSGCIATYVQEMDPLRCTNLVHARPQKLQLPGKFRSNFHRNHGIRDVWLSNSVFSALFRLFHRNLALEAYFNCIFYQSHVILWNNFRAIFAALSSFVFTLFAYHVVSLTASEELLLKFHASVLIFRSETPVLANKVSVPLSRLTGFTKNGFWRLKLGVIFTLKKRTEGVSHKGLKKVCYKKMFCL